MQLDSISQLYSLFLRYPLVCTDSRACVSGSIFFALKGENFNANGYALSALEKGCAYAVIDEAEYELDDRFVLVSDVLKALQGLATFHRRQLGTPIIGITGTNGKTTTKELIASVLKEKYKVLYTQGNLNNHIGVPLTLLQLDSSHEIAVVEMGANHPHEIRELCEIARPDYGIITNVGKGHLEGFGSFEGVMKTKAELYEYIAKNGKIVFINPDNDYLQEMAKGAGVENKTIPYIQGKMISSSPFLEVEYQIQDENFQVKTNLIGSYNTENVLAAATIGSYFSVPDEDIKKGLENYVPQNNRSQLVDTGRNKLIVDAYNANPSSMALAVANFGGIQADSKLLILGDMLELGGLSIQEHQTIIDLLHVHKFENVLLVGTQFAKANHDYPVFSDVSKLADYVREKDYSGYYILIKGSRANKLEKIIEEL